MKAQICLIKIRRTAIPYLEEYAAKGDKQTKKLVAGIIDQIQANES